MRALLLALITRSAVDLDQIVEHLFDGVGVEIIVDYDREPSLLSLGEGALENLIMNLGEFVGILLRCFDKEHNSALFGLVDVDKANVLSPDDVVGVCKGQDAG